MVLQVRQDEATCRRPAKERLHLRLELVVLVQRQCRRRRIPATPKGGIEHVQGDEFSSVTCSLVAKPGGAATTTPSEHDRRSVRPPWFRSRRCCRAGRSVAS